MSKPAYCKPYIQYLTNYVKFYLRPNHINGKMNTLSVAKVTAVQLERNCLHT